MGNVAESRNLLCAHSRLNQGFPTGDTLASGRHLSTAIPYHSLSVTPHLQTSRLLLRPLELADASQTQLLFPHWEIVRYLAKTVPWPYPPDGAHTYYRDRALPGMEREEEWHWTLRLKTEPERLIGSISLIRNGPL
jgi:RimJ/RimL family protein N-acetyltransferase